MMKNYSRILIVSLALVLTSQGYSNPLSKLKEKGKEVIGFTENKGQVSDQFHKPRPDVLYSGMANGMVYHLRNNGISYQLNRVDSWKSAAELGAKKGPNTAAFDAKIPDQTTVYRLDINWKGINKDVLKVTETALEGTNNYYLENCAEGTGNVKSYSGVFYNNLYNKIDLHYYQKDNSLKYDYIIAPGADYKQIQLEVDGAEKISVQKDGSLIFSTPLGKIQEGAPIVYQNGRQLNAKWVINEDVLSFDIENYNPELEMIIDPATRVWGTYYGGTGNEFGQSTCIDAGGNVYLAGYTNSALGTIIATAGSNQTAFGGGTNDAFLVKFNSAGVRQWGTYYGGTGNDFGYGCKADATGNVYLTGYTGTATSALIASVGSHQAAYGGNNDAFLVKFNSAGVRQWGTYYGGAGGDVAYSCATDAAGNVYMVGYSSSNVGTVIATAGSHQTAMGGTFDAFLVKFSTAGVRQWGTYYGGTGGEYAYGCASDATGNVFMTGFTNSGTGTVIATAGSHQSAFGGGDDAFLVKFNTAGVRQWGTYYGDPTGNDYGYSCTTDPSGNVFIAGLTSSGTGTVIASAGSHQSAYGTGYDAFLAKFNTAGIRQWGTYYGDTGYDEAQSCATDGSGNVYLAGLTSTFIGNSIASVGTYQVANGGGNDAFLTKFDASGVRQWGTYYGGVGSDLGYSCVAEPTNYVYLSGRTNSTAAGIISSTGSHQAANGGNDDAFLVRFCNQPDLPLNLTPASNQTLCANNSTTLTASGMGSISWFSVPTGGAALTTGTVLITPTLSAGTYTYYVEAATCTVSPTRTPITVTVSAYPVITVNSGSICAGGSFTMSPSGAATYTFQGGSAIVSPSSNSTYTVIGSSAYGCLSAGFATSSVSVISNPTISVNSGAICMGKSFTMTPSGAASYTFQGGSAVVSPAANSTYTLIGSSGAGCVSNIVTSSVTVNSNPVITVNNGTICSGNSFTMVPSGAISYTYQGGSAVVSPGSNTSYTVIGSNGVGCVSNPVSSFITVNALPLVNATASFSTVCQGQNVNITASGAITYSWNTGATSNVINVTPTVTSSYTVLGTDANGCSKSAVSSITVNPLPTVNIVATPTAVCIGKTATLTASGASSYLWNTASSSPSIAVTPAVTTGYTVTGTSAVGCSATRTIVLVVNPLPTINITPAIANICIGNSATLTASGGNTYTWSTAATTSSIVVTPTTTTNYIVNATDVNGCTNSDNASVVVNALPNVLAAASSTVVCTGSSVTLSSAGAITYSWSNGATTSTTNVSPASTTTYTVFGTNSNGCTNTATVLIAVNALPTILATPASTAMCIGKTTTITASGGSTYVWSTSSTSSSIVVTPLTTTGYTVTGTDINGCTNTGTTTVVVNPLPTISIASSNSMICTGQTVTLTVSGAASYTWNTGSNAAMIADSPTITSTYSVFALDANGCSGSAISSVTVSTFPVLSISSSNSLICVGQSATLTVNGASTYSWSSGGITNLEVVTPTITTNYTVTGTNAGGCATTDTITQFVSPCTGIAINSIVSENLLVYPNPSNGSFMILLPADLKVRITNILGETVFAENLTEGKHQIDLTEFASGLYLVNAEIGGKVKTIKLIKE